MRESEKEREEERNVSIMVCDVSLCSMICIHFTYWHVSPSVVNMRNQQQHGNKQIKQKTQNILKQFRKFLSTFKLF